MYEVDLKPMPDGIVVNIAGEVDVAVLSDLRERLVEAVQDYPSSLRIDLSGVSFLDSSAVGLLVAMRRSVNDYGGSFTVRCGLQSLPALTMRGLVGYLNVEWAE